MKCPNCNHAFSLWRKALTGARRIAPIVLIIGSIAFALIGTIVAFQPKAATWISSPGAFLMALTLLVLLSCTQITKICFLIHERLDKLERAIADARLAPPKEEEEEEVQTIPAETQVEPPAACTEEVKGEKITLEEILEKEVERSLGTKDQVPPGTH